MPFRVILWDVDGTLLDFLAAERSAVRALFKRFGLGECTDEMIARYSRINTQWWERLERGEYTRREIMVARFAEFFAAEGLPVGLAEAFNEAYQPALSETVRFEEGAEALVRDLRAAGYRQYVVTNGSKVAQDGKLTRSGLGAMMDGVFISEEIGAEKPSAAFFDAVFAAVDPEGTLVRREAVIVGDSLTSDIRGGVSYGLTTVWYNPSGKPCGDVRPDREIRRLDEVRAIVGL